MAYIYICDACKEGRCKDCEVSRGSGFAYGQCMCPNLHPAKRPDISARIEADFRKRAQDDWGLTETQTEELLQRAYEIGRSMKNQQEDQSND